MKRKTDQEKKKNWIRQQQQQYRTKNRKRLRDYAKKRAKWRRKHKPEIEREILERYKKSRRDLVNSFKQKPCVDCGVAYPPWVMDFDHRDPKTKSNLVSQLFRRSKEKLLEEISKCDVVCSNCHRERTHKQGF